MFFVRNPVHCLTVKTLLDCRCTCGLPLQMWAPVALADTCCICAHLLHLRTPAALMDTLCTCGRLLHLWTPVALRHFACLKQLNSEVQQSPITKCQQSSSLKPIGASAFDWARPRPNGWRTPFHLLRPRGVRYARINPSCQGVVTEHVKLPGSQLMPDAKSNIAKKHRKYTQPPKL